MALKGDGSLLLEVELVARLPISSKIDVKTCETTHVDQYQMSLEL